MIFYHFSNYILNKYTIDKLKNWINSGGNLIGFRNTIEWLNRNNFIQLSYNKNLASTKDLKFKDIILELEFICLDKNLVTKIKRLFTECGININKIVSYEYAKKFLKAEKDITLCLSAKEVINGANYSEVKIEEEPDKKTSIFNKIFNFFD